MFQCPTNDPANDRSTFLLDFGKAAARALHTVRLLTMWPFLACIAE